MTTDLLNAVPKLNPLFRLQWEPAQESHVLLYPEGMVQLNGPASEILTRVDGSQSVQQIIEALEAQFPEAEGIADDVLAFTVEAHEQNWISL